MMLRFWTQAPLAPLPRLSSRATRRAWLPSALAKTNNSRRSSPASLARSSISPLSGAAPMTTIGLVPQKSASAARTAWGDGGEGLPLRGNGPPTSMPRGARIPAGEKRGASEQHEGAHGGPEDRERECLNRYSTEE